MRGAQPTTGVTPKLLGLFAHAQRPGARGFHMLKPNLDAPGPTLLNMQDRTVRRRTERTMLPLFGKNPQFGAYLQQIFSKFLNLISNCDKLMYRC